MLCKTVGIVLFLFLSGCAQSAKGLHPVILVPGDGGSQVEAKLDKPTTVHYVCTKKTDEYFSLWLNLELLVPIVIDCWVDNMRLIYNFTTRGTENSDGVIINVPGFGNTTTVELLDPSGASPGVYFKNIVEQSLIPLGYVRDENIRGAPYDFRKGPHELDYWFTDFKAMIEEAYQKNGNASVILLSHSMGGPMSLLFIALVSLAAPWGGSVKAWKVFAAGDDLGSYVLPAHTLRGAQRTYPSTAWLLPSKYFWGPEETLVSCPEKGNYTVMDFERFFKDMNYQAGYEMWKDTEALLGDHAAPGIEVHCLHGIGVSTVDSFTYTNGKYFPDKPSLVYGNGDGTVNVRSLRGCLRWASAREWKLKNDSKVVRTKTHRFVGNWRKKHFSAPETSPKIFHQEFPGVDHMEILRDKGVYDYVREVVSKMNKV
ncbi:Group XV phospholipase A2 [Orchesella cincta]|uniref:Group XV phospholipase A2 n=1 Tax=Orchesella cincta TaxID=48709 RepID=A0A1D2NC57_ORCCI|nr:Group XV phospholipase A2 [Orchesella cincta]